MPKRCRGATWLGLALAWAAMGCMPPQQPGETGVAANAAQEEKLEQCSVGEPARGDQPVEPAKLDKHGPRRLEPQQVHARQAAPAKAPAANAVEAPKVPALPPGEGPRIAADELVFDYGTVAQGEKVTHTFVVKNTGKLALDIDRADGG